MAANNTFTVGFSDRTTMTLPKSELVSKLTDLSNNKLTSDARWQLRDKLTDWNFNAFSAFMLDVHAQLAIYPYPRAIRATRWPSLTFQKT